MPETLQGVDISVYQGQPAASWWRTLAAERWRVAVVGSWHGTSGNKYAEANLRNAREAGLLTATYMFVWPNRDPVADFNKGRAFCGNEWANLRFVGVDCEIDGTTISQIEKAVQHVIRMGKEPVIYTARWWWRDHFGDPTDFKHLPLWSAFYDKDPDIDFASAPYGGWTPDMLIGEQYAGTTPLHHVSVDKNTFAAGFVSPAPAEEVEDEMTDEERARLDFALNALGVVGQRQQKQQQQINFLGAALVEHDHEGGAVEDSDLAERLRRLEEADAEQEREWRAFLDGLAELSRK